MEIKVKQVLKYLRDSNLTYDYYGKLDIYINGYSSLNNLQSNSITWVKNKTYYNDKLFFDVNNILVVAKSDILDEIKKIDYKGIGFIICNDPKQIFFSILSNFFNKEKRLETFISPTSVVETDKIGQNVYIGHNSYIGKNVVIGDNTVIENNASIYENTVIGKNTIIHSGAVIGKDGFGYFKNNEGKNIKVPHYGKVIIGESVEIGANTCIDKGTLGDTVIGSNVKINSLCHIAHNVNIQENCVITEGVIVAGSVIIEKNAYIAPGAVIRNQLIIGENSLVGMGAVVIASVERNKVVAGVPAKVIRENE